MTVVKAHARDSRQALTALQLIFGFALQAVLLADARLCRSAEPRTKTVFEDAMRELQRGDPTAVNVNRVAETELPLRPRRGSATAPRAAGRERRWLRTGRHFRLAERQY
jgi:hypothetical protein